MVSSIKNRLGAVLWNSLGYLTGQLGLMVFSFISFPLFTRVLTKGDYGLLALTSTTLSMIGLIIGAGLPNAIVRFAPEYSKDGRGERYLRFNTAILTASMALATAGAALFVLLSLILPLPADFQKLATSFQYVAVVLVCRAGTNILLEFFRVERRVALYNGLCFLQRIATLSCSIAGYAISRSVNGLLLGLAFGESIAAIGSAARAYQLGYWKWAPLAFEDCREALRFTFPMMMGGACASILNYSDRYFIQGYVGSEAVAGYSVAYDMCLYIQVLIMTSFRLGALPEIVSKYSQSGEEEAGRFLGKAFRYFSWLIIGVAFGSVAVGKEALTLLASNKYAESANFLPYLVPGILISGLSFLFASGLYLKKRNDIWFYIIAGSTALNIGLNFWIIPKIGTIGAAITTLTCYLVQAAVTIYVSNRFVRIPFDIGSVLRTLLCGAGMFTVLNYYMANLGRAGLIAKVISGALIYSVLLVVFEKEARQLVWQVLGRRPSSSSPSGPAQAGDRLLVEQEEKEVAAGQ